MDFGVRAVSDLTKVENSNFSQGQGGDFLMDRSDLRSNPRVLLGALMAFVLCAAVFA